MSPALSASPTALPDWLQPLAAAAARTHEGAGREWLAFRPPPRRADLPGAPRRSAVLILFGEQAPAAPDEPGRTAPDPDILVTTRAATLRSHAGQAAFPGGRIDPQDPGPVEAALREAEEEAGVEPASVEVFAQLPELYLPPSDFLVTPVLGWWRAPGPLRVGSPREVASLHRVAVSALADPANRLRDGLLLRASLWLQLENGDVAGAAPTRAIFVGVSTPASEPLALNCNSSLRWSGSLVGVSVHAAVMTVPAAAATAAAGADA